MATLEVISDWLDPITQDGIGYWAISTTFIVGGSPAASSITGGDITRFVKDYSISRGRSSELDRTGPGILTLTVDNLNNTFTPINADSQLSGSLLPGRTIKVRWIKSGSTYTKFIGKTFAYSIEPTVGKDRQAIIECVDDMERFQRRETRSTLYTDIRSGCLINSVLDNAEFPSASRAIDGGQDIYGFARFERRKIDEVLVDINQTEYGNIFINGSGYFVFHDRYYRSQTVSVSASFNESMADISFARDANDLRTEARVNLSPKVSKPETIIWTLNDPIAISPSSTASFFGNYIDPTTCRLSMATNVASLQIGIDALLNSNASGTGTDLSNSLTASISTFAESFKITARNSGSITGYLTKVNISGCPIVSHEQMSRSYIDTSACALYGIRTLIYDAPLMSSTEKAKDLAVFLAVRYSNPANIDRATISIVNSNDTNETQILSREIDDRISITASAIALDGKNFFIGHLNEYYDAGTGLLSTEWRLETLGTEDGFFLINSDVVGGAKGVGY